MKESDFFLKMMINYDSHEITKDDVYDAVERGDITPEEYEQITGLEYKY